MDYSGRNLRRSSFKDEQLSYSSFKGCDLRGVDFSGSDLRGVDFRDAKTGIPPVTSFFMFIGALLASFGSGYIAMLAGQTIQGMIASADKGIRIAGFLTVGIIVLFVGFSIAKGVGSAVKTLVFPAVVLAFFIGMIAYAFGMGTGLGMLYLVLALILVVVMFFVGTVARTVAGTLSDILFTVVAIGGGMYGKSVGGGLGTVVLALSCMIISKRALSGKKGFETLVKVAQYVAKKFGTSFRATKLSGADFTNTNITNCDFTDADITAVNWGNSEMFNSLASKSKRSKMNVIHE